MSLETLSPAPALPSILRAIGNTPLVRARLEGIPSGVELWAKCEWFNPGGSVKDRTALSLISEGERTGALRPGRTIIDSSSGNTAVGLALVGRAKGYPVELLMPASVSQDRKRLCRAYGARITLTDAFSGSDGAIAAVREKVAAEPERYFYADQYRNPANPLAHYRTTAPEIWEQTAARITHFVAGLGTSGTVGGTARYLRERNPRVRVVAVEPAAPLHGLEGLKHMATALVPEIYDPRAHDEKLPVSTEDAYEMWCEALGSTGLFVGHSAAAALWAAREVARTLRSGVVVALLPDGGERYLSALQDEHPRERGQEAPGAP
jgi:cysteine synthase B